MAVGNYQFIALDKAAVAQFRGRRKYVLKLRQQPLQSRMCGYGEKVDRRPIDPPPIIHLEIQDLENRDRASCAYPYYFMHASLLMPDSDNEVRTLRDGRTSVTTGSSVSSLYHLTDLDDRQGAYFVFSDMSVRMEGTYRLKFTLFEIINCEIYYCASVYSDAFQVFAAKKFPGMRESTLLSRAFAAQGLKIRVRKDVRPRKQAHAAVLRGASAQRRLVPASIVGDSAAGPPVGVGVASGPPVGVNVANLMPMAMHPTQLLRQLPHPQHALAPAAHYGSGYAAPAAATVTPPTHLVYGHASGAAAPPHMGLQPRERVYHTHPHHMRHQQPPPPGPAMHVDPRYGGVYYAAAPPGPSGPPGAAALARLPPPHPGAPAAPPAAHYSIHEVPPPPPYLAAGYGAAPSAYARASSQGPQYAYQQPAGPLPPAVGDPVGVTAYYATTAPVVSTPVASASAYGGAASAAPTTVYPSISLLPHDGGAYTGHGR